MSTKAEQAEDLKARALEVDRRLDEAFRARMPDSNRDMTQELVHAVLSQNTTRKNYNLAYRRLFKEFGDIESIAEAPLSGIEKAIRPGGLSRQKSRAIKSMLQEICGEKGDYSLEFVRDMKVDQARKYLVSLPGVGPKTASVVLMFADRRKVLPVDTHVLRTSTRIGLLKPGTTAEKAEAILEELVPPARRPRMHLNLVRLGREVCGARGPICEICPLNPVCDYFGRQRPQNR